MSIRTLATPAFSSLPALAQQNDATTVQTGGGVNTSFTKQDGRDNKATTAQFGTTTSPRSTSAAQASRTKRMRTTSRLRAWISRWSEAPAHVRMRGDDHPVMGSTRSSGGMAFQRQAVMQHDPQHPLGVDEWLAFGTSVAVQERRDAPMAIGRPGIDDGPDGVRGQSLRAVAKRHGINPKTVAKWQKRTSTADRRTGPSEPKSTVLSVEDDAVIVAFRRHTLLPLDDCLHALQASIPHLTRSSLRRCLQRHGISRLPDVEGDKPARRKFKAYAIGYVHIDIAEVQTAEGKLYLYVAIDRTSKFAVVQVVRKTGRASASAFLVALIAAVPYRIHTVLTDNGIQFTFPRRYADGPTARSMTHMFDMRCRENGIEHRLTKVKHPWTNGHVERMNRTIKEATVKRFPDDDHQQFETHLSNFVSAYNFARRLKTLKGLTPYEFICQQWNHQSRSASSSIQSIK